MHRLTLVAITTLGLSACSFLAAARGMKDTKVASVPGNYDRLIVAANDLGWAHQPALRARLQRCLQGLSLDAGGAIAVGGVDQRSAELGERGAGPSPRARQRHRPGADRAVLIAGDDQVAGR